MGRVNWVTVGLLFVSNLVMLYAWYGHLRSMAKSPAWLVILVSWNYAAAAVCIFAAVYFVFRG